MYTYMYLYMCIHMYQWQQRLQIGCLGKWSTLKCLPGDDENSQKSARY